MTELAFAIWWQPEPGVLVCGWVPVVAPDEESATVTAHVTAIAMSRGARPQG